MAQRQAGSRRPRAAFFVFGVAMIDPRLPSPYHPTVQPVISAQQMRQIDRLTVEDFDTPSLLLMEAAAEAVAQAITAHFSGDLVGKKARILCGPGNNGGDGAGVGRALARVGVKTDIILFGKVNDTKGDARTNFEIVRRLASFEAGSSAQPSPLSFLECPNVTDWEDIARPRATYDIIVDALFGTGLTRPLEGVYLQVIQHLAMIRAARERSSRARPLIVSVDIPSGLNADLAHPIGAAVQSDLTITFAAPKPGNVLPPASHLNGELVIANIGSPCSLIESTENDLFLIRRGRRAPMAYQHPIPARFLQKYARSRLSHCRIPRLHRRGGTLRQCRHEIRRRVSDDRDSCFGTVFSSCGNYAGGDDNSTGGNRSGRGER